MAVTGICCVLLTLLLLTIALLLCRLVLTMSSVGCMDSGPLAVGQNDIIDSQQPSRIVS